MPVGIYGFLAGHKLFVIYLFPFEDTPLLFHHKQTVKHSFYPDLPSWPLNLKRSRVTCSLLVSFPSLQNNRLNAAPVNTSETKWGKLGKTKTLLFGFMATRIIFHFALFASHVLEPKPVSQSFCFSLKTCFFVALKQKTNHRSYQQGNA